MCGDISVFSVYFYNFGMPDYGVSSLVGIIDGVKVLAFAVREGRVAIHCHAGLGRTGTVAPPVPPCECSRAFSVCVVCVSVSGVLIACYLVYTLRLSPSEAVHYVRIKRPRSIQTRAQINQVFSFARLLGTQLVQYPDLGLRHGAPFTLQHYLNRQALLLHGREGRALRHTPKVRTGHECRFREHGWLGCRTLSPHPPGGVPPVRAALLPGPGCSCSSRGACGAGEEVHCKGSEQDGEGDPGDQTLPTPPERKQQEFMGRVSDLLG